MSLFNFHIYFITEDFIDNQSIVIDCGSVRRYQACMEMERVHVEYLLRLDRLD